MLLAQAGIFAGLCLHAGQKLALLPREPYFHEEVSYEFSKWYQL